MNHDSNDFHEDRIPDFIGEGGNALPHDEPTIESSTPPVSFPEPTFWERYGRTIGVIALVAGVAVLFGALLNAWRARRVAALTMATLATGRKGQWRASAQALKEGAVNRGAKGVEKAVHAVRENSAAKAVRIGRGIEQLGWNIRTRGPRAIAKLTDPIEQGARKLRTDYDEPRTALRLIRRLRRAA